MPKKEKMQKDEAENEQADLSLSLTERLGKKDTLDEVLRHYKTWLPRYQGLAQGRSNFQIEKIIATEQVTPAASYQHTLFQLRVLHQALIEDFARGIERTREFEYKWKDKSHDEPIWWHNEQGGKKLCWYDTDRLRYEHELEELKMSVKDKLLQLETFTKVLTAMEAQHGGKAYTQQELNDEEPDYWKLRLAAQMTDTYLDRQTGLGPGNIRSLRMGMAKSPIKGSKNQITEFPDLLNATLSDRQSALEVLNEINEQLFSHMDTLGHGSEGLKSGEKKPDQLASAAAALEKLRQVGVDRLQPEN